MARDLGEKITAAIPILTMGVGLIAWYAQIPDWWLVFVVGWVVLTPLAGIIFGDESEDWVDHTGESTETTAASSADEESTEDALETLRDRYARGELSEEQFERKLERLLETETVEDARDRIAGGGRADERAAEREREL